MPQNAARGYHPASSQKLSSFDPEDQAKNHRFLESSIFLFLTHSYLQAAIVSSITLGLVIFDCDSNLTVAIASLLNATGVLIVIDRERQKHAHIGIWKAIKGFKK